MQIRVFVPMPDECAEMGALAGERLVPYRCGVTVLAMLDAAARGPAAPNVTSPPLPATSADRLP